MALSIISPQFSPIQFNKSSEIESCNFSDIDLCLPVFDDNDIAFQFIVEGDEDEIDALCTIDNAAISIGITDGCENPNLITFDGKPQRMKLSLTQVLYYWSGLPDFESVISIGECFFITVTITDVYDTETFCSQCLQRIAETCDTSVIAFDNDDDFAGFNYCGGTPVGDDDNTDCDPTFITFTNVANISIPYTASMLAKYGTVPSVQVWIYDESDTLVDMGIRIDLDALPPSVIKADFGGMASGVIKIM